MPHLSFSELIKHHVPLSAAEAVELTLAVGRLLDARRTDDPALQVPGDEFILLGNTGHVTFTTVHRSTDPDESSALAALTRRLLQLDDSASTDRRRRIPGGLLILLARTLREIDLPSPDRAEFRTALARFAADGPPSTARLSAVFWRAAAQRPGMRKKRKMLGLLSTPSPEKTGERRSHGLSRTELRRALRDLEREVFEHPDVEMNAIQRVARATRWKSELRDPRAAVAGALVGSLIVAIIAGSGMLDRVAGGARPLLPARRAATEQALYSAAAPRSVPLLTRELVGRDVFSPSFDPRGQAIYFHAGRFGAPLMRAAMTGTGKVAGLTKLLDDGAANYHVTMSPNGTMIAFDSDRDGTRSVYVADPDGRNARRISGEGYASVPSWSPDSRRIAFVRAEPRRPTVWNVWLASIDDGALRRVTAHRVGQPWGASWFPDGRRLAYSREQQLVILDLDTGRSTIVSSPRRGHLVRTPAVSPDGARVVFQVHRDGAWMLDVQRMMVHRILPDPSAEEFVWSPNGRTIAYHARSGDGWGVWTFEL
jgi:hypothetical protein